MCDYNPIWNSCKNDSTVTDDTTDDTLVFFQNQFLIQFVSHT